MCVIAQTIVAERIVGKRVESRGRRPIAIILCVRRLQMSTTRDGYVYWSVNSYYWKQVKPLFNYMKQRVVRRSVGTYCCCQRVNQLDRNRTSGVKNSATKMANAAT